MFGEGECCSVIIQAHFLKNLATFHIVLFLQGDLRINKFSSSILCLVLMFGFNCYKISVDNE